jgi:hypothetical protein
MSRWQRAIGVACSGCGGTRRGGSAPRQGGCPAKFGDDPVALAQGVISKQSRDGHRAGRCAAVIMVDDFPRDLGKSEIFQTTEPVTFEALQRKSA